jgi:hypothetical protein
MVPGASTMGDPLSCRNFCAQFVQRRTGSATPTYVTAVPKAARMAPIERNDEGNIVKLNKITIAYIVAGIGAAIAVGTAPVAAAASVPSCVNLGNSTQRQTPGNVQITDGYTNIQSSGASPSLRGPGAYGPFFTYDRGGR